MIMGRFHRHDDGRAHEHEHVHGGQEDARKTDHGDLSGYRTAPQRVDVLERIFGENDRCAAANRELLDAYGVVAVNVMSSPGAGKTTLLQHTLAALAGQVRVGVVVGDIETSLDADRLVGHSAQVVSLNTSQGFGGECHLDAPMVASALERVDLTAIDLLFVENVGNLVCPAEFDVGAHHRIMVSAITEGEEKPLKYPVMFRSVDLVLVNKMDLLPHLDVDLQLFERNLAAVNPAAAVLKVSARTQEGLAEWVAWVRALLGSKAGPVGAPTPSISKP
jgi:hydrogenase nickel incorporation protein HypB